MPHQNTVFRQSAQRLPWARLDALVVQFRADKGVRTLTTRDMRLTLLFAQLSDAKSLRTIEGVLQSQDTRRYHSGLPDIRRSILAYAGAVRPIGVFTGVLAALIPEVIRPLRQGVRACVCLIDSTTMPLSGLSGTWSHFSATLCCVKAHVVYDPDGDCPLCVGITPARINDVTAAKRCRSSPAPPTCSTLATMTMAGGPSSTTPTAVS